VKAADIESAGALMETYVRVRASAAASIADAYAV
jgi:hypothetical protein